MTDFRALCARMADELDRYRQLLMDNRRETHALATEARAALFQYEPEGPTDDAELLVAYEQGAEARWREGFPESFSLTDMERASKTAGLRAVLARWGRTAPQPVPVSERLPGPGDCDAEGECYWFDPEGSGAWYQDTYQGNYTHWLPVHALPLPQ